MSEKKTLYKLFPEPVFHYKLDNFEQHNKDLLVYMKKIIQEFKDQMSMDGIQKVLGLQIRVALHLLFSKKQENM